MRELGVIDPDTIDAVALGGRSALDLGQLAAKDILLFDRLGF